MRKIYILLAFFFSFTSLYAQNWESLPLNFQPYAPALMYYDSVDDVSYIAGQYRKVNDTICNLVKWDGVNYTLLPAIPNTHYPIVASIVRYNNKLYVGGDFGIAIWEGNNWGDSSIQLGTIGGGGVYDMLVHDSKLYVVGLFDSIADLPIKKGAIFNGTSWTDLYRADTVIVNDNAMSKILIHKNKIYVAGNFGTLTSTINEIAMFDGQRWTDVGHFPLSVMGGVNKLLVWNDTLYVGGMFDEQSGGLGNAIVKWDGATWHRLNNGVLSVSTGAITDLLIHNNELYACGGFSEVDKIPIGSNHKGLAKWDGSRWCWLGTSADNFMLNFGRFRDDWYIMGGFNNLNGMPAHKIARWVGGNYTDTCSEPQVLGLPKTKDMFDGISIYPNPIQSMLNLKNVPSNTNIMVFDVLGRQVYNSVAKEPAIKINTTTWQQGLYFIRFNKDGKQGFDKVVKQ